MGPPKKSNKKDSKVAGSSKFGNSNHSPSTGTKFIVKIFQRKDVVRTMLMLNLSMMTIP